MGRGAMTANAPLQWMVEGPPNAVSLLVLGTTRVDAPPLGGTLVPSPTVIVALIADGQGRAALGLNTPPAMTPGTSVFSQAWVLDATAPAGVSATNALQCTAQ